MTRIRFTALFAFAVLASALMGCAENHARIQFQGGQFVNKPDVFIVRPFAVDLASAQKDRDVVPEWILKTRQEPLQLPEDVQAGQLVAASLAKQIVTTLESRGIPAAVAAGAVASTGNSVIVAGHFVNAASATGSLRPAVGYRAGKKIETRIQLVQGGRLLSELEINAGSEDSTVGIPDIARQVAEVVVQAYINRGWLPPPHK